MSEHDLQASIFASVAYLLPKYPELEFLHAIPNGGQRHKAVAAKLKAEGVKAGVPDVCLPIPRGGYFGLYRECKWGRNDVTEQQQHWLRNLGALGYSVGIWRTVEQALEDLINYCKEAPTKVEASE